MVRQRWATVIGLSMAMFSLGGGARGQTSPRRVRVQEHVVVLNARVEGQPGATAAMGAMIDGAASGLRACYATMRRANPGLVGRLDLDVSVGPKGMVIKVESGRTSTISGPIVACVSKVLKHTIASWPLHHAAMGTASLDFFLTAPVPRGAAGQGGGTRARIAGGVEANRWSLGHCVVAGRQVKVTASGVILFDGHVSRVRVRGRHVPRSVRTCLASAMKQWRFSYGKGGHRSWFMYPLRVTGGTVRAVHSTGIGTASASSPRSSARPPRPGRTLSPRRARGHRIVMHRPAARAAPKVGLLEIRVKASTVPGGVDSKKLGRILGRIVARMKRCGGLRMGSRFQLKMIVDPKGKGRLVRERGKIPPRQSWRCLAKPVARTRFPVAATMRRGYQIRIEVRRPGKATLR